MFKFLLPALSVFLFTGQACCEPYRVGVIAPLTGRVAVVGESLKNAIVLENEESSGEVDIQYVFEDDEYTPKNSVSAAQKLINVDRVKALIVFGSGPAMAVAELSSKRQIPLIAMAFSGELTERFKHVYRIFLSAGQQIALLNAEIQRRNYSSIALMTAELEATKTARSLFLELNRLPLTADEEVLPADLDLKTSIARLKVRPASAALLMLYPPQIAVAARTLRKEGYSGDFFGLSFMLNPAEIAAAQGALEGAWAIGIDDRKASGFNQRYQARFGSSPWHDGSISYDIARLLREHAKGDIEPFLNTAGSFEGIYGTYKSIAPRNFVPPAAVKVIRGGNVQYAR